jgi:conjugal transfer ATP-binding protein TraC
MKKQEKIKERKIAVLKVESINYSIKPEEERKAIIYAFQKFLNSLDFPIQIIMNTGILDLDAYLNASEKKEIEGKVFKEIYREYVGFLRATVWDNSILNKSFYIVIPETTNIEIQIKICKDRLSSLNLKSFELHGRELTLLLSKFFSGKLLPEKIINSVDHVEVDGVFHRIIHAYGYPRMVESGFLDKLVSCPGNFDLSLHIQPCSVENTLIMLNKELQKQRADLYAAQIKNQLNPSLEIKYADTHKILEELQKGSERLFNVSLYIDCKANSLDSLNLLTRKIESELNSLLIIPKQANFRMIQGFKSCMPFAKDELKIKRNITTSALSAFFPFTSSFFKFDETGVWLGSNKNGIPIIRDIFKLSNANGICLATSGSGKSYMAKLLISRYLLSGVKVLIIDPQGEYARLVGKFGGQRIDLSADSDTIINPLDLMGHEFNEKRLALMDLMPVMLGDLSEPQKSFLDIAITRAYEAKGINKEPDTWGEPPPILGDLVNILIRMEKGATSFEKSSIRSLINRLNMYVNGVFSFLNKQTNLDFKNNLVCFDIGNLPKQVKPAIMFLVLDYIYTKMRSSLERKLLVIDEAWSLLSRTEDASYILEIVKTCRKFNLGLFLINQEVENMLDSQAGRSVLANTSYTLLLRQKPAMIRSVQNVFHLSEAEKVLLLTARPGEGLLLMENEHSEINITASRKEHEIITTNADELLVQKKEIIAKPKKTPNKIRAGQKAYLKKELGASELKFLETSGFKEVKEKSISGKDETYLVIEDKNESPNHIICIKEIVDYLKQFTQDIQTYRTVKPDIVFDANGNQYAIEVETGKINNLKRLKEKVVNLKKYYDNNWFFFVTNRNLFNYYSKSGKVMNKRTLKTKIDKIFKKSKK